MNTYHEEIVSLKAKLASQQSYIEAHKGKQNTHQNLQFLRVTGLTLEDNDVNACFLHLARDQLDVDFKRSDFSARKIRPKKPGMAQQQGQCHSNDLTPDPVTNVNTATRAAKPIIIVEFYNFWVRRQVYAAKRQLKDTVIFISEQLHREMNALFFKCDNSRKTTESRHHGPMN